MMQEEYIRAPVTGTITGIGATTAGAYVVAYSQGELSVTSAGTKSYISYVTRPNHFEINTIKADPKVRGLGGLLLYLLVLKALSEGKNDIYVNPPISPDGQQWCDRNKFNHADPVMYQTLKNMVAQYGAAKGEEWSAAQMGGSLRVQSAIFLYFGLKDFIATAFGLPA